MPSRPNYVKKWKESYKGYKLHFRVQASSESGALRTSVKVSKTVLFGLLSGKTVFSEKGSDWVTSKENLTEQTQLLRQEAKNYIDNVQNVPSEEELKNLESK
jgi:hypothetical protein